MSAFGCKADMTVWGCLLSRSLLGVKRTCRFALHMSAYDPKRTSTKGTGLPARIGQTGIVNHGRPRRVYCGLPTKALLLFDFGGGLQRQHLERGDRETPNFILWGLLCSGRARSIQDDKAAAITIKICFFMDRSRVWS